MAVAAAAALAAPAAPSDESLLEGAVVGNRPPLEELFRRYGPLAYRVAFRLLGNEPDALDAVQDGFVKALAALPQFEGRSTFKTWLLRVVSNAALDLGRQRGRREARRLSLADPDEPVPQLIAMGEASKGLERADLRAVLDTALDDLSEPQRQTFV